MQSLLPAALASDPIAASVYTMTSGRTTATIAGLIGLTGLIIGIRSVARPARRARRTALAAGLIGVTLGGLVVATADGGLGTGNGLGGGIVALIFGSIAVALAALSLTRSRRTTVAAD